MRPAGRSANQVRPVTLTRNYTKHAEGSVLVEFGDTKVLCTASIDEGVPRFLKGQGQGWITAEYGMLPRSTHTRNAREAAKGKQGGRTMEIQRLMQSARQDMEQRGMKVKDMPLQPEWFADQVFSISDNSNRRRAWRFRFRGLRFDGGRSALNRFNRRSV